MTSENFEKGMDALYTAWRTLKAIGWTTEAAEVEKLIGNNIPF